MAQALAGQTKMQAAKQAFDGLLSDLAPGTPVGLEVYGHHGDRDCAALEIVQPVAPLDAPSIRAHVQALQPLHGATPIAAALERAGEALATRSGPRAIVLISDGEETCGGDPVAVARRLRAQGVGVVIHVVGLAVTVAERSQLEAIASQGGGSYHTVGNASELEASLQAIEKQVTAAPSAVVFEDDFDGDALGPAWEVIRPSEDALLVEDGKLTLLLQPGWPTDDATRNLLLYRGDLPRSYRVEASFEAEIVDYPDFRPWETQRVGLVLYRDANHLIELTTSTSGVATDHLLQANFGKYKQSDWVASHATPLARRAAQAFRIEKRGHEFRAFVKDSQGKWIEAGSVSDLKGAYRPGILAYRAPSAKETTASYDRFEIRSLD